MSAATVDVPVFELERARGARCRGDAVVIAFPGRSAGQPPAPGLRLTRRGRLAVTLTVASLVAVTGLLGASSALAGTSLPVGASGAEPVATAQVVVHPGQTLWEIASAAAPAGADVRDVIIDIRELSGLGSSAVYSGQELTVPAP